MLGSAQSGDRAASRGGLVDELNLMIEPILLGGGRASSERRRGPRPPSSQERHRRDGRARLHVPRRVIRDDEGKPRTMPRWTPATSF